MKKQLGAALVATIVISTVFLALRPHIPSALAQYSWTDNINIYKHVRTVYTDIRKIRNNETVPVDVRVYITFTENINRLEYYRLSANGTDFIIISQRKITLSNGTYYGLGTGQTLWFRVEAEGASSLSIDDIVRIGVRVEFWSAEFVHDIASNDITCSKTIVGQGFEMYVNVTVENQGNFTETFNVTCYANTTFIQTQIITNLVSGESRTVSMTWNTTGVDYGNYTIRAVAEIVPGEADTTDNTYINGQVLVTIAGDIDGDLDVDYDDFIVLAGAYGSSVGEPAYKPEADIDNDDEVDYDDFIILAGNYMKTSP